MKAMKRASLSSLPLPAAKRRRPSRRPPGMAADTASAASARDGGATLATELQGRSAPIRPRRASGRRRRKAEKDADTLPRRRNSAGRARPPAPSTGAGDGGDDAAAAASRSARRASATATARELHGIGLGLFHVGAYGEAADAFDRALSISKAVRDEERSREREEKMEKKKKNEIVAVAVAAEDGGSPRASTGSVVSGCYDAAVVSGRQFLVEHSSRHRQSWNECDSSVRIISENFAEENRQNTIESTGHPQNQNQGETKPGPRYDEVLQQSLPGLMYQRGGCDSGLRPVLCPLPATEGLSSCRAMSIALYNSATGHHAKGLQDLGTFKRGMMLNLYRTALSLALAEAAKGSGSITSVDRVSWCALQRCFLDPGVDGYGVGTFALLAFVAYNNLACLFHGEERYDRALPCLRKAAKMGDAVLSMSTTLVEPLCSTKTGTFVRRSLITVHANLARVHLALEDAAQAVKCNRECLKMLHKIKDSRTDAENCIEVERGLNWDMASVLYNLGMQTDIAGRREEAQMLLWQATDVLRSPCFAAFGTGIDDDKNNQDPRGARYDRDMCTVLCAYQCREAEKSGPGAADAVSLYITLQHQREMYGPTGHPAIGTTLSSLGTRHFRAGEYDDAIVFFREGLRVERATLEPAHPNMAVTLNNMGQSLHQTGHATGALRCYRAALRIKAQIDAEAAERPERVRASLPVFATVLFNIGMLHSFRAASAGRQSPATVAASRSQALQSFQFCARIRRSALGPDHPDVASALHNAGVLLLENGQVGRGLSTLREALRVRRAAFGESGDASVVDSLRQIGTVLLERGELDEALLLLAEAADSIQSLLASGRAASGGLTEVDLARALGCVGQVRHARGEREEALASYTEALEMLRQQSSDLTASPPATRPLGPCLRRDMAQILNAIGAIRLEMGDLEEAAESFAEESRLHGTANPPVRRGNVNDDVLFVLRSSGFAQPPAAAAA